MKVRRPWIIVARVLLALAFSSGCKQESFTSPLQSPIDTSNALAISDKTTAIEIALANCQTMHLRQDETPYNIEAHLMPLIEAAKLVDEPGSKPAYNLPDDTPIWVVQMQGKWHVQNPVPSPEKDVHFYNSCSVLINAQTGYFIGNRLK
jgi:hypothetical protein